MINEKVWEIEVWESKLGKIWDFHIFATLMRMQQRAKKVTSFSKFWLFWFLGVYKSLWLVDVPTWVLNALIAVLFSWWILKWSKTWFKELKKLSHTLSWAQKLQGQKDFQRTQTCRDKSKYNIKSKNKTWKSNIKRQKVQYVCSMRFYYDKNVCKHETNKVIVQNHILYWSWRN